jgi:hypothetical protein
MAEQNQSTLTLFMTRIGADNTHHTLTTDDFAMAADALDRSLHSHFRLLMSSFPQPSCGTE